MKRAAALLVVLMASFVGVCSAQERVYSFGVIAQRSPVLHASYWNPILHHVSARSGVPLRLALAKTGPDHSAMIGRGAFDFVYSNHNFTPTNSRAGYRVIARPRASAITGQIVVREDSDLRSIQDLAGKAVVFPSRAAFVGYYVPMDALVRAGVEVQPFFAGNQEGAMGQFKSGRVVAAAVNSRIIRQYAEREGFGYRVIWTSEPYLDIPVSAHPSVPASVVRAVRRALVAMADEPEGARILAASARLVRQHEPYGFTAASDADYENCREFFRRTVVAESP